MIYDYGNNALLKQVTYYLYCLWIQMKLSEERDATLTSDVRILALLYHG